MSNGDLEIHVPDYADSSRVFDSGILTRQQGLLCNTVGGGDG